MGRSRQINWPPWWDWELEFSSHVLKRMVDRCFCEVDLRHMMSVAVGTREDHEPGRWVVQTSHDAQPWEVIVEPDADDQMLVVITAYPMESP